MEVPLSRYSRRHRASGKLSAIAVVGTSMALHGLLLLGAELSGIGQTPVLTAAAERAEPAAAGTGRPPSPSPSCEADVALATAARMFVCATPLGEGQACVRKSMSDMSLGFITCDAVALATDVSLVTPEQIEQIEPEPLLELLDPARQEEFEEAQAEAVQEKFEAEQKKLETPPEVGQQVVEVTRPNVEAPPENTRFLAEFDSRADKQTVARGSTEKMVERPELRELLAKDKPREASVKETPEEPETPAANPDAPRGPGKLAMRVPGSLQPSQEAQEAKTIGLTDGKESPLSAQGFEATRGNGDVAEKAREAFDGRPGQDGGGGGRPMVPNLRPTEEILERTVGGGSVDSVDDVDSGETTQLNTKRWKYATFFNRMKRHVAENWNPGEVYARRDPTGNVYGGKTRVTLVQVSLSPQGEIARIHILKSSGVDFLDEEAVRAFRAAQPFPNPPEGLVDQQSKLITFSFGFHFEIGGRNGWKIFRHR